MLKKAVSQSTGSIVFSVICTAVLAALFFIEDQSQAWRIMMSVLVAIVFGLVCFFMPIYIRLTDNAVEICRPLMKKSLPLEHIKSVSLCQPTMGARRICGSGGFYGWWGWFREGDIGKYFAYYGKASDCFLVVIDDGRKYMLGCNNAPEMVSAIKAKLAGSGSIE